MNSGVSTMPTVTLWATSGLSAALPMFCSWVLLLPPVSRSVKPVEEMPTGWNRSFRLGARMSTDMVPRKRSRSFTCQLGPIFQV